MSGSAHPSWCEPPHVGPLHASAVRELLDGPVSVTVRLEQSSIADEPVIAFDAILAGGHVSVAIEFSLADADGLRDAVDDLLILATREAQS